MNRRRGRVFPRRTSFYDTVFSQPAFWVLVAVVTGALVLAGAAGLI